MASVTAIDSKKKRVEFEVLPGEYAWIKHLKIAGFVTGLYVHSDGHKEYKLVWWHNESRHEAWLLSHEIEAIECQTK